jgi:hypothetical protein
MQYLTKAGKNRARLLERADAEHSPAWYRKLADVAVVLLHTYAKNMANLAHGPTRYAVVRRPHLRQMAR